MNDDFLETVCVDSGIPGGSLILIMKWGGELTPLGKYQSEQLGKCSFVVFYQMRIYWNDISETM